MFCSSRNLTLGINVAAALLVVTIINAYLLSTKFQLDAERDLTEHYTKHIHVNPNSKPTTSTRPQSSSGKPFLSSNNPNPLNPNGNNPNQGGNQQPGGIFGGTEKYPRDTCVPHHTTQQELLDLPLTVVTATSESYVGHVHNLIGSLHVHQPDVEVAVYNLGLDENTIKSLENYCGVTVHDFDFSQYPQHVRALKNFAWKALVVQQAVEQYGKILYLDSGYEVRQPLEFIRGRIEREGYFCTGMGDSLTRGGREAMFNFFKTSTLEYLGLPMTAGGVHGVTYWGGAYKGIIMPATECSVDPACITPERTGDEVRSFGKDQPLFSNLVYRGGCTQCAMSPAFTAHASQAAEAGDPFTVGRQHLFHRRGSGPFNGRGNNCNEKKPKIAHEAWDRIRQKYNVTYLGNNGCPHTRFSQKTDNELYSLGDVPQTIFNVVESVRHTDLAIVTAATREDFAKLQNLVVSATDWEPNRKVVVYNLGLSEAQVTTIQEASDKVVVEKFDVDSYPSHVSGLSSGAYLPIVLSLALEKYGSILYLSPTHIIYQRLDTLIFQLERDGIFSPTVGGNVLDMFSSASSGARFFEKWPAVPEERRTSGEKLMEEFKFKPQCTAAVLGFWKDSLASKLVLPPLKDCSLDPVCWQSAASSITNNQRPEGLLLSLMIYDKICYTCNRDYDFYAYAGKKGNIIHQEKDFDLFSRALIDEVQVLYDTKDERR